VRDELSSGTVPGPPPYAFTHAGATLVVEEQGHGGHAFVLIHGLGMGRGVFQELAGILADHGRVLAMDLPGYGEAPEPPRVLTMQRTADLVAALLTDRGLDHVTLVGHSMGTQVAVEIAVRHPQLVERLVLVAPTVDIAARTATRQMLRLLRDIAVESPTVILRGAREYVRAGPNQLGKMRAMLAHRPEDVYPRIGVPTLVLRGEHDYVAPQEWCRFVVSAIPGARLVEVAGHGHETLIRNAARSARSILDLAGDGS
jgi:pimeloyl-ACP methyl ester carboxylesterase